MNQRIKYILFSLLACCLVACYEDKGNYDYKELTPSQVSGLEEEYKILAYIDTLKISPSLTPQDREYDCWWGIYPTNIVGMAPVLDTIAFTRELNQPIEAGSGTYMLVFCARDVETGLAVFEERSILVETSLTTGWFFMKDENGMTDMDVYTSRGKVENLIAVNNGGNGVPGEARTLLYSNRYSLSANSILKVFMVGSEQELFVVEAATGKILRHFDDLFYQIPRERNPEMVFGGTLSYFMINNGKVHSLYNMSQNSGKFNGEYIGDYRLSRFKTNSQGGSVLVYDELTSSFCTMNSGVASLIRILDKDKPRENPNIEPVNNLDSDLLYMGATSEGSYALLKKKNEELYVLRKMSSSINIPYYNNTLSCDTLDNTMGLVKATHWAANKANQIIYFAKNGYLWSCNVLNNMREEQLFPMEGEITFMEHLRCLNPDYTWSEWFMVATYNAGKYKVYQFNIRAGKLEDNPRIYEGDGRVKSTVYVTPMFFTNLD